jgi:hypothetical protein
MNIIPKNRYTGFVAIIILFLILSIGIFTLINGYENEQRLIKRGFVTLKLHGMSIQSKINVYATLVDNGQAPVKKSTLWDDTGYDIYIDSARNTWFSADSANIKRNHFTNSATGFFSEIMSGSFFDEYVVFKDSLLFYKSIDAHLPDDDRYLDMLRKNMYLPNRYKIFSGKKDSMMIRNTLNAGYISKVNINYTNYYQFVYPIKIKDENWYISGLLADKNYIAKKQHVETWLILFIGILLIFTLLSFQFIKLFLLSKSARIRTSDMVLISFSISGIACIVTLLVINLVTLSGLRMKTRDDLGALSDSISSGFTREMNLMYEATEDHEEIDHNLIPSSAHILTDDSLLNRPDFMKSLQKYPYFKSLFLSDTSGKTKNILTTWKQDISSPVSYRQYYKFRDEWLLPRAQPAKRFRLESIYSNTSGDVMAVLARPSKFNSDTVYCISSIMYSVINTVLPPGFEFRIIGEDGHVWFHSDERKNNRDNFLDECNHHAEVQEALHNRVEVSLPLKISLENYQANISPIGTLPLYLVTMRDTRELNEFLSHINYILFLFIAIGIFGGLLSTGIFFYEKLNTASGYVHDKEPGLIWLLPDKRKNNRYIILTGLNMLLGLFISIPVLFRGATIVHFLLILITAYSFSIIYIYSLLKTIRGKAFKKSVIFSYSFVIVCCNIFYSIILPGFWLFFTLELLAVACYGLVLYRVSGRTKISGSGTDAHLPYVLFVFSWIVFSSVLPTLILFRIAANEEADLLTRKSQVEMAAEIERKNSKIDSLYIAQIYPKNDPAGNIIIDAIKYNLKQRGNYLLNSFADFTADSVYSNPPIRSDREKKYINLNRHLRQMFRSDDIRSYHMLYGAGLDTMWSWTGGRFNRDRSDTLTLFYFAKQKDPNGFYSGYRLALYTIPGVSNTGNGSYGAQARVLQALLFILLVLFLFLMVRSMVKFFFFLEMPAGLNIVSDSGSLSNVSRLFLINTRNKGTLKNTYHAENATYAKENPKNQQFPENSFIVLNLVPENTEQWKQFSMAMGETSEKSNSRVVILSHFTPAQLLGILEEQINSASNQEIKLLLTDTRQKLINYLSGFIVYFQQYDNTNVKIATLLDNWLLNMPCDAKKEFKVFLEKELKFADIPDVQNGKFQEVFTNEQDFLKLVPKLFNLFSMYYQRLWEQCTQNEKVILVDVAVDSLVNSKNKEDIKNLIGKGILEVDGRLSFTSQGFKRYVTKLSESDEFHNLEYLSKTTDGWNNIRNPLYIIFGAVVVFFFFTQQDVISGLYGAIISITGLIGALFRFGLLGKQGESTK